MPKSKRSFFERLTGSISLPEEEADELLEDEEVEEELEIKEEAAEPEEKTKEKEEKQEEKEENEKKEWPAEEEEGQLTVDMYQTPSDIVIKTMVAGVDPRELEVSITQDMITLKGERANKKEIENDSYFYKELYWGNFSRSILLPQEVDSDSAKASFKNGLLTIRLPKVAKNNTKKLEIHTD